MLGTQALRDYVAAGLIRELREARGWSPERVPHELEARDLPTCSGKTIRRIEDNGVIPQVRIRFALSQLFEREVKEIWNPLHQVAARDDDQVPV